MGFFDRFFKKKSIDESEHELATQEKDSLNLNDPVTREQYVMSCLEQMKEASLELDRINAEYSTVTSYLTDMEEIEALTGNDKKDLVDTAKHLHELRQAHDKYVLTPSVMTDHEYNHVDAMADEISEGIEKLLAEEDYKKKVKSDLRRIGKERNAYDYRKKEVGSTLENIKGISTIVMFSTVVLIVILFLLQVLLKLDVALGYYIAVIVAAIAITVIYLKFNEYSAEKKRIDSTINELILLENKVKIRYVNNKNLLDYLYTKYEVDSAAKLKDLYERYLKEKADRRAFERNEAVYEDELSRLIRLLKRQRVKDPEIWIHQYEAIYDNKEMVEMRHGLIGRRQKLRKQMEYNQQIALEASDEIKEIMKDYPKDAPRLLELVNKFGQI